MEFESAAGFNISVILDSIGILKIRKSYLHSRNLKEFVIVSLFVIVSAMKNI